MVRTDLFSSRVGRALLPVVFLFSTALLSLTPRLAHGMASDGALITNVVSATYGGMGGPTIMYTVSYNATSNVLISCPAVMLSKVAMPTVQASGSIVTFQIWITNASMQASAFNVEITDAIPDNMSFVNPSESIFGTGVTGFTYALSANGTTWQTSGALIQPAGGQGSPYYLRWNISQLAPGKSELISYQAMVL